jgi:hypothetical protein
MNHCHALVVAACVVATSSCLPTPEPPEPAPTGKEPAAPTLDDAFRIDISTIDVTLDATPGVSLDGTATLTFTMRPGQTRALFHFSPVVASGTVADAIRSIVLDGETLDVQNANDVVAMRVPTSTQDAFELQRDLGAEVHTLTVTWAIAGGFVPPSFLQRNAQSGWLVTNVNDLDDNTLGIGNETLFPTINSPEELARHVIEVRVHDPRPCVMVGSGTITASASDAVQTFTLDTLRDISSYTVLVAVVPKGDVTVRTFAVLGVPVTIASTLPAATIDEAVNIITESMTSLNADFGAFPMPSFQVLLLDWESGMEYYGGSITGMEALSHEVIHMVWGCSTINGAWRDTWLDEAINVWWEARPTPIDNSFLSDIVIGRRLLESGFDPRAYDEGSQIIAAVAARAGGDDAMIAFLRDLHERRLFAPYSTDDFINDAAQAFGDDALVDAMNRWVNTVSTP